MADKARFYLEQSIPELQALEKNKIFTKDQITAITKKRSSFEHRVNATGATPADFARYAEYEMNLESLRRLRTKRLGIKARSHSGQRRIFFILDRATRRFHGDLGLWMQYVEYARKERAGKVLAKVFSTVLKLHPGKPELWVYAARHAVEENADVAEGRSHMQRGLRFNKGCRMLWLEYAKLELVYVAKVLARRRMLGIDGGVPVVEEERDDEDEDMIKVPDLTGEDFNPTPQKDHSLDTLALENIDTNPALNGAVALAIFDSAVQQFPSDIGVMQDFFALFCSFSSLGCRGRLLEHVVRHALDTAPTSPAALMLGVELPIIGVDVTDPIFPGRLATVIANMNEAVQKAAPKVELYERFAKVCVELLKGSGDIDEGVKAVVVATLMKQFRAAEKEGEVSEGVYMLWVDTMIMRGKKEGARGVAERGVKAFPKSEGLRKMKEGLEEVV